MARRDTYIKYLSQVPLFSACSQDELRKLGRHTTQIPIREGDVLTKEGDLGHEFFIILEGSAKVSRRGRKVGELGVGSFFGELALLIDRPRNATVTALTPMQVIVLSKREFKDALDEAPRMMRKMVVGLAERLSDADSQL